MARDIFSQQIRDTTNHTASIGGDRNGTAVYQYVNTMDQSATVTLYGTHENDTSFTDRVQLSQTSVSAGGTAKYATDEPWDLVQVSVSSSTAPTSGEFVAKQMG